MMKLAVLSESPADEAALRILVDAVLGQPTEAVAPPALRSRGWPSVRNILPAVIKHLYYQTDADGLVVVVDSNGTLPHDESHSAENDSEKKCRLCQLQRSADRVRRDLRPVATRGDLGVFVGLACPAVEAWYRCGLDPEANEAAWRRTLESDGSAPPRIKALKQAVYGTDRPGLQLEIRRAQEEARRLAGDVECVERAFPGGFGSFADHLRRWTSDQSQA
ncbi:MAG: hypothetical protein IID40_01450 [Planctomycetes bacterium]|nr:hypothetical protein [Planctomycetota bacterium]